MLWGWLWRTSALCWWWLQLDEDIATQRRAVKKLGELKDPRAIKSLIAVMKGRYGGDPGLREAIVTALGQIGGERAIKSLVPLLKDKNVNLKLKVAKSLDAMGWQPEDDIQRVLRAIALQEWDQAASIGVSSVEPLLDAYHGKYGEVREDAERALTRLICDELASPSLIHLFRRIRDEFIKPGPRMDWETNLGWKIVGALGEIGDKKAVEFFIEALSDPSRGMRKEAIKMLGKIGDDLAIEPLIAKLISGGKVSVVSRYEIPEELWAYEDAGMAAEALAKFRDRRSIKALIAVYETTPLKIAPESYIETVLESLASILDAMAAEVMETNLRAIAAFRDQFIEGYRPPSCGESTDQYWKSQISCSRVRQLARQELIRRGLTA